MSRTASQNNTIHVQFDAAPVAVPFGGSAPLLTGLNLHALKLRMRRRGPGFWLALVAILLGDAALAWFARITIDLVSG